MANKSKYKKKKKNQKKLEKAANKTASATTAATTELPLPSTDVSESIAYPKIDKVDTKKVVLLSLLFVVLIFILCVLFPQTPADNTPDKTTEDTNITTEDVISANTDPVTGFTTLDGNVYYYPDGKTMYTGWYKTDNASYYFDTDGTMMTGWYSYAGHYYFFDETGVMQTGTWIENRFVDSNGRMLRDTSTPDGYYVDENGIRDDSASLSHSTEGLYGLKTKLNDMLSGYSGTWSVYVKNLDTNEYLVINNEQHFSASLIKLYCAATVYDLIERGTLKEDETITRLLSEMISVSDNDAFNLLVMKCAPDNSHVTGRGVIQNYIDEQGYADTTITSILVPSKYTAPSSPGRNYTTVVDCGLLLENIYRGECVSDTASKKFLDLLLAQNHINKIPAGLPEGTKCANKTGDTNEVQHDAAIVYSPSCTYIFCVMSSNCGSAIPNIQQLSDTVYTYFNPEQNKLETPTQKIEIKSENE